MSRYEVRPEVKKLGEEIIAELEKSMDTYIYKAEVGYIFRDSKHCDFIFYTYANKYDYKRMELKYIKEYSSEIYVTAIKKALINGEYEEYISTPEKRFLQDIINESKCEKLYFFEDELCSVESEDSIYVDDIDTLNYDKTSCELYIKCDNEEYKVDLVNETIDLINDEKSQSFDKLDLEERTEIIQNAINNWNEFDDTWCKLFIKDNKIYTKDKENGGEGEICELNNINDVDLDYHDKNLFFSFIKPLNKYFDNCKITKDGIEC